ncbi:MAG: hypothetical protein NTX22_06155 [Ignavibacteriales bacterium]|nr:hypothetical protein [Ignavibacteriales bacterium]
MCEGATEVGICRAINNFRLKNGKKSATYLGVAFADGTGSNLISYCEGYNKSKYQVCLFCDSDNDGINKQKESIRLQDIKIIDWSNKLCLEKAIYKYLPIKVIKESVELAARLRKNTSTKDLWKSVCNKYDSHTCKECFSNNCFDEKDNEEYLRDKIGEIASGENGWYKNITKGEALGDLIFDHYSELEDNELKQKLNELSNWIDNG